MGFSLLEHFPGVQSPPILSAPMAGVSGPALCEAVASAGGLPFLAAGYKLPDIVPPNTSIGFLVWHTKLSDALELIQKSTPPAVWLHAPRDPLELQEWVTAIKKLSPAPLVFYQCADVQAAQFAADLGVEVIVAQGSDAGGHGNRIGAGMVVLVSELADAVGDKCAVVAAGGIMDGRSVAAALAAGAAGAVLGTRLIPSFESSAPDGHKELCLRTKNGGASTIRTRIYDELRGRGDWPGQYDGRAIQNETFWDQEEGTDIQVMKERYEKAVADEDWQRLTAFAGTGVGLVDQKEGAADIVKKVREEAKAVLKRVTEQFA